MVTGIGAVLGPRCPDLLLQRLLLSDPLRSRPRGIDLAAEIGPIQNCPRRFSGESMESALKKLFTRLDGKVLTLRDTYNNLIVRCFDINSSPPFVFSRADATESPSFDFEIWKVCPATSATPGIFKSFDLCSIDGKTVSPPWTEVW